MCLATGDRAASSWVGILGGSVNDLKATSRGAIAVDARSFARNPGGRLTLKPARNRQTKSDAS